LRNLLEAGAEQITAKAIEAMLDTDHGVAVRDVRVATVDLRLFDQLFNAWEVLQ